MNSWLPKVGQQAPKLSLSEYPRWITGIMAVTVKVYDQARTSRDGGCGCARQQG